MKGKRSVFVVFFLMTLSLHIQFPVFAPFAAALGATSLFISLLMSSSSFAHLCGHLLAGPLIDRIGKKPFIVLPLFLSSLLLASYGWVRTADALLFLKIANGFVLAFLTPACLALLSCYAVNSREQGRNIAINGIFVTLANMIAPLIGGRLVHIAGYQGTYFFIGAAMFISALVGLLFIREEQMAVARRQERIQVVKLLIDSDLMVVYFAAFCLMFAQGTLFYEMPLQMLAGGHSERSIGELFSFFSLGSLIILSMLFINRLSPASRTLGGMLFLGFCFYRMTFSGEEWGTALMLMTGMGFGLLMPAAMTLVSERIERSKHGTVYGILSAFFSLGSVAGPLLAGLVRPVLSPFFIAFLLIMLSVLAVGIHLINIGKKESFSK